VSRIDSGVIPASSKNASKASERTNRVTRRVKAAIMTAEPDLNKKALRR
jgi:hypothetical protein